MNSYDTKALKEEWESKIASAPEKFRAAMSMYSTEDYYKSGWLNAKHGKLILEKDGTIYDVNQHFCTVTNYTHDELVGRNVSELCDKVDDLVGADCINTYTLLLGKCEQCDSTCMVEPKNNKSNNNIIRCNWVANRIPASTKYPFSHSVVHIYFLNKMKYSDIAKVVSDKKEHDSKMLNKLMDQTWFKVMLFSIIGLTAVGGSLPDIVKAVLQLFNH